MSIAKLMKEIPPYTKLTAISAFVLLGGAVVEHTQKAPNISAIDFICVTAATMFFGLGAIRELAPDDAQGCEKRWSRPLDSDPPL